MSETFAAPGKPCMFMLFDPRFAPKREEVVRVELSAWQSKAYADLRKRTLIVLHDNCSSDGGTEEEASLTVTQHQVTNTLMQLRKIVLHPFLFEHLAFRKLGKSRKRAPHKNARDNQGGKKYPPSYPSV